ncbi:MAG: glycosyltransferase family 39 protein [Blastocatellia bacterium]|nr:glycosyltransferase family 39 protein [Blastocatellia bacterium]
MTTGAKTAKRAAGESKKEDEGYTAIFFPQAAKLSRRQLFLAFAALFLLNLLLRVFYLRYDFVSGDEAVRALTAVRFLEGARLYTDIVTDKPPGATLFYASAFALFGRSMTAVHLAAALWNFITSVVIYLTAARFYSKRTGLTAALLFIYFSTNYLTHDMMAANTELLMALPLTASFYFFMKADNAPQGRRLSARAKVALFVAGLMAGIAILFKQVGVTNLAFFVLYEAIAAYRASRDSKPVTGAGILTASRRALARLSFVAAGLIAVAALFIAWLAATDAIAGFWRYAIVLGKFYAASLPRNLWIEFMFTRTLGYILFNASLWSLAVWAMIQALRDRKDSRTSRDEIENHDDKNHPANTVDFDLAVALWGAVSLAAVFAGGRFFGHYFIQVLPALSLLGSRGIERLGWRLNDAMQRPRARVAAVILVFLFLFGFVRFHSRTAVLAYETLTGASTLQSQQWGMTIREREAEEIALSLRDQISEGEPLYIWDYALDVYWQTRTRPASRFLVPYYLTGQYPDSSVTDPAADELWRASRRLLIEDLERTRPRLILDVYGAIETLPYEEITLFIKKNYRRDGQIGPDPSRPFVVFRLKE